MEIRGLPYIDGKITSYLFVLDGKKILFDFGTDELTKEEIYDLDYIIISHFHHDHCFGLLKNYQNISSKCKIIASNTTFNFLVELIENYYESESKINEVKDMIEKRMYIAVFNRIFIDNSISMTFYPSGHTFGSMMVLIESKEKSIFISSDMDYDASNILRQYSVEGIIKADYAIIDGTCLDERKFKMDRALSIKFEQKKDLYLKFNFDKAIFAGFDLAEKYKDTYIIYQEDLYGFISSLHYSGYDVFYHRINKIVTQKEYEAMINVGAIKRTPAIFISSEKRYIKGVKNNNFNPNSLFSLHIVDDDRDEFINNHFTKECKIILGHYDAKIDLEYLKQYCQSRNFEYIRKGKHYYG